MYKSLTDRIGVGMDSHEANIFGSYPYGVL